MAKKSAQTSIHVSVDRQTLVLKRSGKIMRTFPVSTSRFGLGSEDGSMKTPLGKFQVAEKFGEGLPIDTAFKSREPVRASAVMLRSDDLIMSRILWLEGSEPANANSHARYIYIHGTNHEEEIGRPASHGCVRMKNADVAELFDLVPVGTPVVIASAQAQKRHPKKVRKALRIRSDQPK